MDSILVVNAGSSSVKFQVFQLKGSRILGFLLKGQVDGLGAQARLRIQASDGAVLAEQAFSTRQIPDVPAALNQAAKWLRENHKLQPVAAGHRVAHGGPDHDRATIVDRTLLAGLSDTFHSHRFISRTISRQLKRYSKTGLVCCKLPALTLHFTEDMDL